MSKKENYWFATGRRKTSTASVRFTKGKGKIICEKFPNHSKVLLCDTQYAICGSANWMSNTGYHNREVSIKIEEPELINDLLREAEKDFVN